MPLAPRVRHDAHPRPPRISVIVCAWNEQDTLAACLYSVLAQTRPPDEIIVVDNASSDHTSDVARAVPGVRVVGEPRKGLTRARETGRRASTGDVLAWLDADCRAPLQWLEQIERYFQDPLVVAVSGPFRYYDWTWHGRGLLRAYDLLVALLAHHLVRDILGWGALLYGGNFAVRHALHAIGGFDTSIEFHGEDTNLGRRLHRVGGGAGAPLRHVHLGPTVHGHRPGGGAAHVRAELLARAPVAQARGHRAPGREDVVIADSRPSWSRAAGLGLHLLDTDSAMLAARPN